MLPGEAEHVNGASSSWK